MSYSILTDRLPDSVEIGGKVYAIHTGFRTAIRFETMVKDIKMRDEEKLDQMVRMFFHPVIPEDIDAAIGAILWFYNGGKPFLEEKEEKRVGRKATGFRKNTQSYSFTQDAGYIYASFMQQYGISLQRMGDDDLHWWEFLALFDALGEDTKMGRVIYYRTVSTAGMSVERRKHVNEMKKLYALREEVGCEKKVAIARRNANWKLYVRRRMEQKL